MTNGPLFGALASRALEHPEAADGSRRRHLRRFAGRLHGRLERLAARSDAEAPVDAGEMALERPHGRNSDAPI